MIMGVVLPSQTVENYLKTIYLDPGAYDLAVRASGKDAVQKRVYVLSGKTVKLEF